MVLGYVVAVAGVNLDRSQDFLGLCWAHRKAFASQVNGNALAASLNLISNGTADRHALLAIQPAAYASKRERLNGWRLCVAVNFERFPALTSRQPFTLQFGGFLFCGFVVELKLYTFNHYLAVLGGKLYGQNANVKPSSGSCLGYPVLFRHLDFVHNCIV